MSENKVDGPFKGLKKLGDPKKVAKCEISRIISMPNYKKRSDQKGASFQIAAMFLVAFLLILLLVSLTQTVSASGTPTAAFSALQTSGCSPLTVTFTETSNGNGYTITKWEWDFNGDGAIDRTDTTKPTAFTYTYTTSGTYTVTLKVTTAFGTNTITKTGYITAYGPPTSNFTATPSSGCSPLTVAFANTSNGNGRTITGWTWDFGDSTTYNGQTPPDHLYSSWNLHGQTDCDLGLRIEHQDCLCYSLSSTRCRSRHLRTSVC